MRRSSEYVSPGHPDKIADYISQYLFDRYLEKDRATRYAVEVMIKDSQVVLGGEVTSKAQISHAEIQRHVRDAVNKIGYTPQYQLEWGEKNTICGETLNVLIFITQQSPDIASGVNRDTWGDQGIFFGYATPNPETEYMPTDHALAKRLCRKLFFSNIGGLDIKTQVEMIGTGKKEEVERVIIAIPIKGTSQEQQTAVKKITELTRRVIPGEYEIVINGTGTYLTHSSIADCGITGRKLVVDLYGSGCKIGGGSPWTKDATKADLALNIYARALAKTFCKKRKEPISVSISCEIGSPLVRIEIFNAQTGKIIASSSPEGEDVPPSALKDLFRLESPIFASMTTWGLFGEFQKDKRWETI